MDRAAPVRHLAHLLERQDNGGSGFSRYALQPVTVPRPAHGQITAAVECQSCGEPVACTVYSIAGTRRLRLRAMLLAAGCAAAALVLAGAVGTTFVGLLPDKPASTAVAWFLVLGFMAVPGLGVLAFRGRRAARDEDGLRLVAAAGSHSLRAAGDTFDSWYATEAGGE